MNRHSTTRIFADFEYRNDGKQLILGCFLVMAATEAGEVEEIAIDFRPRPDEPAGATSPQACVQLQAVVARFQNAIWFSYAAQAEITACLTAGVDIANMHWICLLAESKQITASHSQFYLNPRETNLLTTLNAFGIATEGNPARKQQMRDLILTTDQYSAVQWDAIVEYCWSDIHPLPTLWQAIRGMYAACQASFNETVAVFRGDYLKATATLEHHSRGFPVDGAMLNRIYENTPAVIKLLAEQINEYYGAKIYLPKKPQGYKFTFKELYKVIAQQTDKHPLAVQWESTPSGRPRMDEEYLEQFVKDNPFYERLKDTYFLIRHFNKTDLRPLVHDGFVKGVSLPYHTTTGRNQPLVSRGFMLNLRPWMRSLIRPEPGHVIVAADWSQQEIVIAAAFSGDQNLKAMLDEGDVYLSLAKAAGAIPEAGTKAEYPIERQIYKSAQLGIGYGMKHRALGLRIYIDLRNQAMQRNLPPPDLGDCTDKAEEILAWHHDTFTTFWDWINDAVWHGQHAGYMRTADLWTTFCNLNSNPLRLGNFPVQGNGATIMRQSIKRLAKFPQIEFICSLHDAIYIYCHESDVAEHSAILTDAMRRGTEAVMATAIMPLPIKLDVKTFTHETGYVDERDTTTLPSILSMLDAQGL